MAQYYGSYGTLTYTGTSDRDFFRFESQYDALYFNSGSTIDGLGDIDKISFYFSSNDDELVNLILDLNSGFSIDGLTYLSISNVEDAYISDWYGAVGQLYTINGTNEANDLEGSSNNENQADFTISGLGGNDTLRGGNNTNVMNGGSGNDRLIASTSFGTDTMSGGRDDDTYVFSAYSSAENSSVVELAGQGTDTVETAISYTLGANVENLTLASGYNEYGPDTVLNIDATGNSLDNVIIGNSDANVITAGAGNDTLTGNGGGDTYVFASGDGTNVITDFDHDLDTLDFSAFSASDRALLANPVSNGSGQSVYTAGAFSVTVPELPQAPNNDPTGNVEITGTSTIGGTLTADMSGVEDDDGLGAFTYQWLRDGATISGATGNTLTLGTGDANSNISVNVYYTDGNDYAEFLNSEPVPVTGAVIQVTTTADVVNANDGVTSLREAVSYANAAGVPAVIELGSEAYHSSGDMEITGDITIRGNGRSNTTIMDEGSHTAFFVAENGALALSNLTMDGTLHRTLEDYRQPWDGHGAAIDNYFGTVAIEDATITNYAVGGRSLTDLINVETDPDEFDPDLDVIDPDTDTETKGHFFLEYSPTQGGAIFSQGGTINLTDSIFSDNAAALGGAVYVASGTANIEGSAFVGNSNYSETYTTIEQPPKLGLRRHVGDPVYGEGPDIYSESDAQVIIDGVVQASGPISLSASEREASADLSLAREAAAEPSNTSAPDQAVLDVRRRTDLSLDDLGDSDSAFALVDEGILSEGGRKIVVQLGDRRIILQGQGLSLDGDPYDMTTEELLTAASGTITKITLQSGNGNRVLSTMTGLDLAFEDLVISLTEIDYDNPPSIGDLLGVRLRVTGTGRNDVLEGTEANDRIDGEGGNDRLFGNGGKDVLLGGAGRDTLDAGTGGGKDILDGGAGADRLIGRDGKTIYIVDNEGDIVKEYGSEGNDEVRASISYTIGNDDVNGVDNIENLRLLGREDLNGTGNDLDNVITGNRGDNLLSGGYGDDKIIGGKGDDLLMAGLNPFDFSSPDSDWELGGYYDDEPSYDPDRSDGNDRLLGGSGNDWLIGGTGDDRLTGDSGADNFVFERGDGHDTITDMLIGTDLIVIDSGAQRFRQLDFIQQGDDVLVTFSNVAITVQDVSVDELRDVSNFDFDESAIVDLVYDF